MSKTYINKSVNDQNSPIVKISLILLFSLSFFSHSVFALGVTWNKESIISYASQITNVRSAVNATGTSVVVWDQLVPGSVDNAHPYGINQVFSSICTHTALLPSDCSAPIALSDGLIDSTNSGVVVAESGKATVFWTTKVNQLSVSYNSSSSDLGLTWTPAERIPGEVGYSLLSSVYAEVGPTVGIDGTGNIIVVLVNPPSNAILPGNSFAAQALVKDAITGVWSSPTQLTNGAAIFGSSKLYVNSDGSALLNLGFTTFRRDPTGNWGNAQTIVTAGMGQIYSASCALDAAGKGYFVYRTRYLGAFLSTSTPNSTWTLPKHIAKFDILGSSLLVRGANSGHAIVYGNDMNNGNVRATVTANGGSTWGNLVNFGIGNSPQAAGSQNGFFVLSWNSGGANWDRYYVATGTGIGSGSAAWIKSNLIGSFAGGPVNVSGNPNSTNAELIASEARMSTSGMAVGTFLGTVNQ